MQQQIAVDRYLARVQLDIYRLAQGLGADYGLIQKICLILLTQLVREMPEVVGSGYVSHACVFNGGVINCQPGSYRPGRCQRPVAGVLMPGNPLAVARHLAEEMRSPGDHIFAEQILDPRHNSRMCEDVVNAPVLQMGRDDGITVAAGRDGFGKKLVEVATNAGNLFLIKDADSGQICLLVEGHYLFTGERLRVLCCGGTKPQIALDPAELFCGWSNLDVLIFSNKGLKLRTELIKIIRPYRRTSTATDSAPASATAPARRNALVNRPER
jgi:hypothetical protein